MANTNIPKEMTLGELLNKYAERMALFASRSGTCIRFTNEYREQHREEVDEYIKDICKGRYPLHFILGLNSQQCRDAVLCMACVFHNDEADEPKFARELLSVYMRSTKKEKLPPIDEKALKTIYQKIEAAPNNDQSKYTIAYDAFAQNLLGTSSRAFFVAYAPQYRNFETCRDEIYTNALVAIMLLESANTTAKVRYMERYDYLYRTIVRQRFASKNFGSAWAKDMGTMRARTNTEKEKSDLLQIPIISTFSASGLANTKTMDDHVITKEMTMNIAVTAYTAANIDNVEFPIEQVWEAIDTGKKSAYDDDVITAAKEKREAFTIALFNSTYYTLMCERNKKTILEALHDYFFNPQGARLNVELKRCQRRIASDDEKLQRQKDELKAYKSRTDAAERAAEDARNRYAGIQSKVETQQEQIAALEEKLRVLQEENERLRKEVPAEPVEDTPVVPAEPEVDCAEELKKLFASKKVVIIGGHPNIMTKFAQKYPDAAVIEKDKAMTADKQLDGAAAVLFKTDSMSHKEYTPIKDLAGRKGVPVGYIGDVTSLGLVEKSVYEELKKLNILG